MAAYNSNSAPDQPLSLRFLPCSSAKRRQIHSTEGNSLSTKIVQLGDDLLVEILIRLPNPRSACRCKAVCKEWKSLISHPIRFNRRFVSHHQSRNRKSVLLLHSDDPQAIISSFIPMATPFTQRSFEVIDSYKDLVLCGFADVSASCCDTALYGELYRTYFLCNPFTKQWVALPLAPELSIECGHFFTRLVCEPRICNDLDLGEDQVFDYSPEYRFRVVCLYRHAGCTKINIFCSDTGEWTKDILVLHDYCQFVTKNVVSCNGEVFWCYGVPNQDPGAVQHPMKPFIAAFNPFRPDIPPTAIEPPAQVFGKPGWDISFAQGTMHVIVFEDGIEPGRAQIASSVWRLEEDRKSWGKVCDGWLKGPRLCELHAYARPCLHPEKPQVFFLRHSDGTGEVSVLSCDLGVGEELEFFAEGRAFLTYWNLFRAELPCWPTSIPRYKQLQVMYDGRYSCCVQSNKEPATTPPIAGTFAMASAKVDEVPAALCDLKSTITDELLAVAEPIVGLRRVPALVRRAAAFYQRQLIQKLQLLDSGIVANDVQLVSRFPGIDPESVVFKSMCNEASHFLIHCHHDGVTYRAMTVYRVHLMEAVRGFETEVAASDKQLSGSAAQTIQGTVTQPTALQNDVINAADAQGAAAQLIVPQNALLGSAAAEVGNHIAAHNALLDGSVAGGE